MLQNKLKSLLFILALVAILLIAVGNVEYSSVKEGTKEVIGNEDQLKKELGATPIVFEPRNGIILDNKTHAVFLFYTTCPSCEDGKNLYIAKSYPVWQGNLSYDEISFDTVNYYRKKDVGEAYFQTFNISKSQVGGTALVVHNSKVGLLYYPPLKDVMIQKAMYYLAKGSLVEVTTKKSGTQISQPLIFALGAVSGFNPCLIALASFFFATATKTELKGVARRIGLISIGLIYAYLVFFSLIITNSAIMGSLFSLAWLVVLILVAMALLHFVEIAHDIYSRKWGGGSSIEAKMPLFRTPKFLKDFLEKTKETNNPAYDFVLGAVFSLIKLPCIAAFLIVLLINSVTPLADVMIFTVGVAFPIILMGLLIGLGMVKVNRLNMAQFKGRLLQRLIIGIALLASAIFVIP